MGIRNLGIVFSPTLAIPASPSAVGVDSFADAFSPFAGSSLQSSPRRIRRESNPTAGPTFSDEGFLQLVFAVEKSTGLSRPIMVEDEGAEPIVATSRTHPAARPNSQLYADSGADKLMEHEGMGRLNGAHVCDELWRLGANSWPAEQADEDESGASDSALDDDEDDDVPTSYLSFPSAPGAPATDSKMSTPRTPTPTLHPTSSFSGPRSPGLPASPRPGATFASSSSST